MAEAHYRLSRRSVYRRVGAPSHVRELVQRLIEAHGLTDQVRYHCLDLEWPRMVGLQLALRTWPDTLSNGVLRVRTTSSAWLHELHFERAKMIARINTAIAVWPGGPSLVSDIRLVLGTPAERAARDKLLRDIAHQHARPSLGPRREPPLAVPEADQVAIRAETAGIEDNETRAVVEAVRLRWNM
ncbi:MAG TPA: DUF721 domain-containing protein [Kofleriaceae bacterium]|jgi:hypothetical protein